MTTEASNNSPAPATPHANAMEGGGSDTNHSSNAPAPKKEPRYLKAKVHGKEELVSEDQLIRDYQKYRAGEERLQAASQKEKQIQSFLEQLETDPEAALNQKGLSREKKKELAERWLMEQIEEEMRDPREAELMELKQQLAQYETKEKQTKEEAEQEAYEKERTAAIQKRQAHLQETFGKAMEMSPLAKDPETAGDALRSMALHYRLAKQAGYEPDPQELAQVVEERHLKSMWAAAQSLDGEALVKVLGKGVLKKLRAYDLAQLERTSQAPATSQEWQPREGGARSKKSSLEDIRRQAWSQR
jgi:hypothetical protein